MPNGIVDGYEWEPTENCGGYTNPNAEPKHLLHSTESGFGSIEGVLALFKGSTLDSPHFTIDPGSWRKMQHSRITQAACALRGSNRAPTNGAMVIQTEICGWAATSQDWNDNVLLFIARHLVDVRREALAVWGDTYPLECSLTFYGTDAGFTIATSSARQRLSPQAFQTYRGVLGHQHAHDNDHWDPGKLNIARVLELANYIESGGGQPPAPEGDLMGITIADIQAAAEAAAKKAILDTVPAGILNGSWERDTRSFFGGTAVKKPGDPKQYLVGVDHQGPFKFWIRDGEAKDVLVRVGLIRQALNFVELTDPAEIAFLDSLPEV